jgi:hypothetical protein
MNCFDIQETFQDWKSRSAGRSEGGLKNHTPPACPSEIILLTVVEWILRWWAISLSAYPKTDFRLHLRSSILWNIGVVEERSPRCLRRMFSLLGGWNSAFARGQLQRLFPFLSDVFRVAFSEAFDNLLRNLFRSLKNLF